MKKEKSCGFILFTHVNNEIKYLLVKSIYDAIGFPKGHMENNETELETAFRETKEEVNIVPTKINDFRVTNSYVLPDFNIDKTVVYFLGEYYNPTIICEPLEIKETIECTYLEALNLLHIEDLKNILKEANEYIKKMHL